MGSFAVRLKGSDIERYLPHRGRNLLIDEVLREKTGDQVSAVSKLIIRSDDPQGRDLFLADLPEYGRCIHPVVLIEHVALMGVVILDPEPGTLTFFSRVRRVEWTGSIREGERLTTYVKALRAPKPFVRFDGMAYGEDGRLVMSSDIMAYVEPTGDLPKAATPGAPQANGRDPQKIAGLFPGRSPEFVFVDYPIEITDDGLSGRFRYTYSADHPLTEGHFPGKPVMMGVSQILSIADAAQWLAAELTRSGRLAPGALIEANGQLCRADGARVCEVSSIMLQGGPTAESPALNLQAARAISFRNMVIPPDTLDIAVRLQIPEPSGPS